jgi:hypothetical protein
VEWTELEGGEAETVLANLLYSEQPLATRVRPSRGDFGLDVLVPGTREPGTFDDYQIKKYARTLTAAQKREVEKSFRQALIGLIRREVPLADWYLVMPVDPTIDNMLDWFSDMPDDVIAAMCLDQKLALTESEKQEIRAWRSSPGRIIKWEGRPFCETMAGKYPFVIDYYLHGGEGRLRAAVAGMTAILNRDVTLPRPEGSETAALVTPAQLTAHLSKLFEVLDTDPHYRYEFSFDLEPPAIVRQKDLVAATQQTQLDGRTLTFRVYRRFAEAEHERPIPFKLRFAADDAGFDSEAVANWRKYGTPLTAPAEVEIDLPGGLGTPLTGQLVEVSLESAGQTYQARLRIRKLDGSAGKPILFSITVKRGPDGTGVWESGSDESGYLTFDTKTDLETNSGTWGFRRLKIVGEEINAVLPSIEFLQDLISPNVLQVAHRVGPFTDYHEIPSHQVVFPETVMEYLRALSIIQDATTALVLVPDLTQVTAADAQSVVDAAALISGQTVMSHWQGAAFRDDASPTIGPKIEDRQIDLDSHYMIKVTEPLIVNVGEQELTLGAVDRMLLSARYELDHDGGIVALPFLNDTAYRTYLPGVPAPDRNYRPVQGKLLGTQAKALAENES